MTTLKHYHHLPLQAHATFYTHHDLVSMYYLPFVMGEIIVTLQLLLLLSLLQHGDDCTVYMSPLATALCYMGVHILIAENKENFKKDE